MPGHYERYTTAQVQKALKTVRRQGRAVLRGGAGDIAPRVIRLSRQVRTTSPASPGLASISHGVTVFRGGVTGPGRSCVTAPAVQGVRVYANCRTPRTPALAGGN